MIDSDDKDADLMDDLKKLISQGPRLPGRPRKDGTPNKPRLITRRFTEPSKNLKNTPQALSDMEQRRMTTPTNGVRGIISSFGGIHRSLKLLKSMGFDWVTMRLIASWIEKDKIPISVYDSLSLLTTDAVVTVGGQFVEVKFKGHTVGQLYLADGITLVVRQTKVGLK